MNKIQAKSISPGKNFALLQQTTQSKYASSDADWSIRPSMLVLSVNSSDGIHLHPCSESKPFVYDGDEYASIGEAYVTFKNRMIEEGSQVRLEKAKYGVMKNIILAKFASCKKSRRELMESKGRVFVYCDEEDLEWGNGVSEQSVDAQNPAAWPGKNLYGTLLMEMRHEEFAYANLKKRYLDDKSPREDIFKKAKLEYNTKYVNL